MKSKTTQLLEKNKDVELYNDIKVRRAFLDKATQSIKEEMDKLDYVKI